MAKTDHITDYTARNHDTDAKEVSALCLRLIELRNDLWRWEIMHPERIHDVDIQEMREIESDLAHRGVLTALEAWRIMQVILDIEAKRAMLPSEQGDMIVTGSLDVRTYAYLADWLRGLAEKEADQMAAKKHMAAA